MRTLNTYKDNFLEKPKSYFYWVKTLFRGCFPMKQDFDNVGEALKDIGKCLSILALRLFMLSTFLISVPIVAAMCRKYNHKTMNARAEYLTRDPSSYTKDEIDSVLNGEKSFKELQHEKEIEFYNNHYEGTKDTCQVS